MCQYKSAIVVRDESLKGGFRLLLSPWTESHSELIQFHKLRDNDRLTFARIEFAPPSMETAHLVDTYKLRLDEERTPDWWSDEIKSDVTERMRNYIRSIIVDGPVGMLMGGQFVLAPGATVEAARAVVITAMLDTSSVREMWDTSSIREMRGTSSVRVMWDTSSVRVMRDNSSVREMWDTSSIREMLGTSSVREMRDTSSVREMWDTSSIGVMRNTSSVREMRNTSSVGVMLGTSKAPRDPRTAKPAAK